MDAKFLINGDTAISVQIASEISIENSRKVNAVKRALEANPINGVTELLPTYCAVMLHYQPHIIRYDELVDACRRVLDGFDENDLGVQGPEMVIEIPVYYGPEWAIDLPEVAEFHHLSEQEIIDIHTGYPFYTYMLGFSPGHPYLGSENPLRMPRRAVPRPLVERGCVVVMNNQSVVEPIDSPIGWNVIGRAPIRIFNIEREDPFRIKAGMWVQFRQIDRAEYDQIDRLDAAGQYEYKIYEKKGDAYGDHR